jgi:hypothetical protein
MRGPICIASGIKARRAETHLGLGSREPGRATSGDMPCGVRAGRSRKITSCSIFRNMAPNYKPKVGGSIFSMNVSKINNLDEIKRTCLLLWVADG